MTKNSPDFQYIYDSVVRIETKLDKLIEEKNTYINTYVTKKESNLKTVVLAVFTLISTGFLKWPDLLTVFKLF